MVIKDIYCKECDNITAHELMNEAYSEKTMMTLEVWECRCCGEISMIETIEK